MVVKGTINKLKRGDTACFTGQLGRFWIQHPTLSDITQYGVYEVTIDLAGVTQHKNGDIFMQLADAPIIGKCLFAK
jgi:hypothetical protein